MTDDPGSGIDVSLIADLRGGDWGRWRTCRGTIEQCIADVEQYGLDSGARDRIMLRLRALWQRIEEQPKTSRWKRRSRLGERMRWYQEPEEV